MSKYIKLMDGTKSNAGGFEIKLVEINIAKTWNPSTYNPAIMGGFNFSTEEKILRWIHRGDTVYDVELPNDAEVIDCPSKNCPHGVFRTNKIILKTILLKEDQLQLEEYLKLISKLEITDFNMITFILQESNNEILKDITTLIKDGILTKNFILDNKEFLSNNKENKNNYLSL